MLALFNKLYNFIYRTEHLAITITDSTIILYALRKATTQTFKIISSQAYTSFALGIINSRHFNIGGFTTAITHFLETIKFKNPSIGIILTSSYIQEDLSCSAESDLENLEDLQSHVFKTDQIADNLWYHCAIPQELLLQYHIISTLATSRNLYLNTHTQALIGSFGALPGPNSIALSTINTFKQDLLNLIINQPLDRVLDKTYLRYDKEDMILLLGNLVLGDYVEYDQKAL